MGKLNQVIAIEKGVKSRAHSELSEAYKVIQKPDLFNGFDKKYQSNAEDGDELPPERKLVHTTAPKMLDATRKALGDLFVVTARKDWTNQIARASIEIDGRVLLEDVPVSYLLFLEKHLTDIRTMIAALPVLDPGEDWKYDAESGLYRTDVTKTHRTKKVQRPLVLYNATPEHPAQTQLVTEDIIEGYWSTVRLSGAIAGTLKAEIQSRLEKLIIATKEAREKANALDEVPVPPTAPLFDYLFGLPA